MVPIHFTYGWVLGKQEVRKKWKSAWCKMTFWQIGKVERAAAKNFPSLLDSYFKKSERKSWKNRRINVIFFKVISLLSKEKCQKNERKMPIQIRFSTVWKRERGFLSQNFFKLNQYIYFTKVSDWGQIKRQQKMKKY